MIAERLEVLLAQLTAALAGNPPGRVLLAPGESVAWDDCCDGQLYIRVTEVYPSSKRFPNPDDGTCTTTMLAVRLGVGVIRCAHTLDDTGVAPEPDLITSDAHAVQRDAEDVLAVLLAQPAFTRAMRWTPRGPSGGCVGGEWDAVIGVDWCR